MRSIRFRTLGCYPLTGAVESEAATLPEVIQEMLLTTTSRAPGPRDRQGRRRRRHGEEEAGGLFLMRDTRRRMPIYETDALIAEDIDAYLEQHQHKTLLRFITCGSVDDGKSTLIGRLLYDSQDDLRGPARRARGRQQAGRHARAGDRLRAAGRRPRRRARAGHHDRRRLPLLRHREAQVHRRRHARATSSTRATWSPAPRPPTSR